MPSKKEHHKNMQMDSKIKKKMAMHGWNIKFRKKS